MSECIDAAVKKLTEEKDHIQENPDTVRLIAGYLTGTCLKNEEFAAKVTQEHKTLVKCNAFITQKAKECLHNQNGLVYCDTVFTWAAEYYNLDDDAIESKQAEADKQAAEEDRTKEEKRNKKAKKNVDQISFF